MRGPPPLTISFQRVGLTFLSSRIAALYTGGQNVIEEISYQSEINYQSRDRN
jgi:hypothetical protein